MGSQQNPHAEPPPHPGAVHCRLAGGHWGAGGGSQESKTPAQSPKGAPQLSSPKRWQRWPLPLVLTAEDQSLAAAAVMLAGRQVVPAARQGCAPGQHSAPAAPQPCSAARQACAVCQPSYGPPRLCCAVASGWVGTDLRDSHAGPLQWGAGGGSSSVVAEEVGGGAD